MQTFLPYPDFASSVACLDRNRLNAQRREARQILTAIARKNAGIKGGWQNHPATKMWIGYEDALMEYSNCAIREWISRGYQNTMLIGGDGVYTLPKWFGDEKFHASHRAALLAKNFEHYSKFGWKEEPKIDYVWPR